MDDVQDVEQLPLVFVNPLDLHVEEGVGVDPDAGAVVDQAPQPLLVGLLDAPELFLKGRVPGPGLQLPQLIEVGDPAVADGVGDQPGQAGIARPAASAAA